MNRKNLNREDIMQNIQNILGNSQIKKQSIIYNSTKPNKHIAQEKFKFYFYELKKMGHELFIEISLKEQIVLDVLISKLDEYNIADCSIQELARESRACISTVKSLFSKLNKYNFIERFNDKLNDFRKKLTKFIGSKIEDLYINSLSAFKDNKKSKDAEIEKENTNYFNHIKDLKIECNNQDDLDSSLTDYDHYELQKKFVKPVNQALFDYLTSNYQNKFFNEKLTKLHAINFNKLIAGKKENDIKLAIDIQLKSKKQYKDLNHFINYLKFTHKGLYKLDISNNSNLEPQKQTFDIIPNDFDAEIPAQDDYYNNT